MALNRTIVKFDQEHNRKPYISCCYTEEDTHTHTHTQRERERERERERK